LLNNFGFDCNSHFIFCSDHNSTSNSIQEQQKVKKQKGSKANKEAVKEAKESNIHHSHHPLMSIMPNDIRRQYTLMFTNTLNSNDFSLFLKFLTKYTSHDFAYAQTFNGQAVDNGFRHPRLVQLRGVKPAAQYWINKLQLIPDVVYNLLDTNVHTYSDSDYSKVVGDMTAKATFMFDVSHGAVVYMGSPSDLSTAYLVDENDQEFVGSKRGLYKEENALTPTDREHNIDMKSINTVDVENYLSGARLTSPPVRCFCDVKLIMHLDGKKAIQRMEFKITPRKEVRPQIKYH
jgi:hypothetical protein